MAGRYARVLSRSRKSRCDRVRDFYNFPHVRIDAKSHARRATLAFANCITNTGIGVNTSRCLITPLNINEITNITRAVNATWQLLAAAIHTFVALLLLPTLRGDYQNVSQADRLARPTSMLAKKDCKKG
jgi:hypothetical protein